MARAVPDLSNNIQPLKTRTLTLDFSRKTYVMGILNVTPDSFSESGECFDQDAAYERGLRMEADGADIIDVGGESTRPGAAAVDEDEEIERVIPVIRRLSGKVRIPISIDTYKSGVACRALDAGAEIINDISGLRFDPRMSEIGRRHGAAVVIMHIKGSPQTMQKEPGYGSLVSEVKAYLQAGIRVAVENGVAHDRIIIDPGFGFGKKLEHNLSLMKHLDEFIGLGKPILIGVSRKSFIGTVTETPVHERIMGTIASCAIGIIKGANIIRIHDVKEGVQAAKIADAIRNAS